MANISQIKLPNGDTHNFIDTTSGYTKNTGTITGIKTTNGAHSTINVTSGVATFNVPTKTSHLTNDSGFATTSYVDSAIDALPEPMLFKGSVGTGGTVTSLPTAAASNNGWTYKVITALSSPSAKVGDTVISNGSSWIVIPSGDEPNGTVTSVAVSNGGGLSVSGSPITSSGTITISHADTSSQASSSNSGRTYIQSLTLDTYGHVTGISTATETVTDTNTHRPIQMNGTEILGNNTTALNLKAGTNVSLSNSSGTVTIAATDTTYESKAAASGGTAVSLVTTGEKYIWNSKTSNTGTITSVKTTAGAHTAINTTSGAVSFNVPTTAAHVGIKFGYTTSGNNRAVQQDSSGNLYVTQKDDNTTYSSKSAASGGTDVSLVTTGEKYTWNSKTSNTGTITSVKTTAGAHSTINITSGAANFNVPTKTSHLTNDSGFITSSALNNYLPLTGGQVTGPTTFGDTVSIDDLNAGQLVVSGSASFANTINGNITTASALLDKTNGTVTTLNYGASGMASTNWFAAWDGYNLKAISPANTLSTIKALPLAGGTLTGDLLFSDSALNVRQIQGKVGGNDYWRIAGGATATNSGWMEIATADDGNEPIYIRQYTGVYTTVKRTLILLDANGDTTLPGNLVITKSLKINNHSSAIGTVKTAYLASNTAVPRASAYRLVSLSLEAGTWIVYGFPRSEAKGLRYGALTPDSSNEFQVLGVSGAENTTWSFSDIFTFTSTTTVYLEVRHNEDTNVTFYKGDSDGSTYMKAVRIA